MHIRQHLLISLSIGAFYLFLSGRVINLINLLPWLIGGVLVDLDHLITYSKRYKTLRLIKLTKIINADFKLNNLGIYIFHTVEFALFLSLMVAKTSLTWQYLAAHLLHLGCDGLRQKKLKTSRLWLKKLSLVYYFTK